MLAFVSLSITSFVEAQTTDFSIADSLFSLKHHEEASLAYEYIIFSHPEDAPLLAACLLKKSECLKANGKYSEVPILLSRLDGLSLSDSLKGQIYFQKALSYYLTDKYELAEKSILPFFNLAETDYALAVSSAFLYATALGESGKWQEAKIFLLDFVKNENRITPELQVSLTENINILYSKENIPKLKSIRKAKTLSLLFPGLGQAYNGNYGKGFVSLALVSGSAAFIAFNIINTTYLTAATAGAYLFLYFYFGGANQSNWLVPKKNNKKKSIYNQHLRSSLSNVSQQLLEQQK